MWENAVIDYHSLSRLKERITQIQNEWEIDTSASPYKTSPQEAMSQIEAVLNNEYDLVHPDRRAASDALDKIADIAFFAGRAHKKVRTSENENEK
jgi:hypothetical protein